MLNYKKRSKKLKDKKPKAFLFGPFLGELSWEFYRFAPYAIYLKKHNPDIKIVVLTREERFDLYGAYSDILIPLRIKNEALFIKRQFGFDGYKPEHYSVIEKYFYEKYKKRFDIVDHFCPLINGWKRKIKWQFPRGKMSYDFNTIGNTSDIVDEFVRKDDVIVDREAVGFIDLNNCREINATDIFKKVTLGIVIESLKKCEFVIGNMSSDLSHLAILLNKPLVSVSEKLSDDSIHLLNPLKTPIIRCKNVNEGVDIYENNFRSEEGRTWEQRRVLYFDKII